jgi:succinate dehydrogenase / fumarate reductase cytochrome b subunit
MKESRESTYSSRTMVWSGPILLLFIVYHLLHLTTGTVHPEFVHGDVYRNFINGFRSVPTSAFYIVAMLALGLHLYHGIWSMLQSLGLSHPRHNHLRKALAVFVTLAVVGVNISFPLAVLAGVLQ